MSSLISTPKAPRPPVYYQPPSAPAPQPTPQKTTQETAVDSNEAAAEEALQEEKAAEQRAQQEKERNLLRRSRGRLGTILTGFRGFLQPLSGGGGRKSLLGE